MYQSLSAVKYSQHDVPTFNGSWLEYYLWLASFLFFLKTIMDKHWNFFSSDQRNFFQNLWSFSSYAVVNYGLIIFFTLSLSSDFFLNSVFFLVAFQVMSIYYLFYTVNIDTFIPVSSLTVMDTKHIEMSSLFRYEWVISV